MILDDVLSTLNVNRVKALRYLITLLGSKATRWLADLLSRWDRQVERSSFIETARDALDLFTSGFELSSAEAIPKTGPLLAVANHPGMYDSIGAIVTVGREDVQVVYCRIMIGHVGFLQNRGYHTPNAAACQSWRRRRTRRKA